MTLIGTEDIETLHKRLNPPPLGVLRYFKSVGVSPDALAEPELPAFASVAFHDHLSPGSTSRRMKRGRTGRSSSWPATRNGNRAISSHGREREIGWHPGTGARFSLAAKAIGRPGLKQRACAYLLTLWTGSALGVPAWSLSTTKAPAGSWPQIHLVVADAAFGRLLRDSLQIAGAEDLRRKNEEGGMNQLVPLDEELLREAGSRPPAFSDEAIALKFAETQADRLRFVAAWGKWLSWTGTHWQFDDTLAAFDKVRTVCRHAASTCNKSKIASAIASAKTVAAVERLARADRRLAATVDQWDSDPWLLNTPQGVVDLRTGRKRAHDPDDHMTKITAVGPQRRLPDVSCLPRQDHKRGRRPASLPPESARLCPYRRHSRARALLRPWHWRKRQKRSPVDGLRDPRQLSSNGGHRDFCRQQL